MCGIAGVIHRGGVSGIGAEMTSMLQALRHRGPDSTGFAIYGTPAEGDYVMRFKVAEQEDMASGFDIHDRIRARVEEVDRRLAEQGGHRQGPAPRPPSTRCATSSPSTATWSTLPATSRTWKARRSFRWAARWSWSRIWATPPPSAGSTTWAGSGARTASGHTRMATESDVDIRSAHPYWAFPYNDVAVVHNGQITNYWMMRREMERKGHRFMSDCDSELLAVYTAHNLANGVALDESLERSVREIDGVFTYLVATRDQLGMAKDTMAAKPLVLYESDDLIALASEEVAIRAILPEEIDTSDPYDEETRVWQA